MSVTLERPPTTWETRPGWGIGIDLTPHQVVQARQVKVHRRLIGLALLLVLLACLGVSLLARADRSSAQDAYDEEQARTVDLAASVDQYADITAMQDVTTRVGGDLSTVMGGDVDVVNFLARVNQALPPGVRITAQSVVLNPPVPATAPPADAAVDPAAGSPTGAAPAPTGQPIGTLSISGSAGQISDVTPFVSALNRLRGAVDVLPTTVARTEAGTTFTITANLTDELLTGRYQGDAMNLNATRPWVIGGVLVALIMAALTWVVVVGPTRSDAGTLREDAASVQTQNDVLASRVAGLERQAEGRAELEAGARAALSALPAEVSLPDLNRELGLHAQSRGVEIVSISVAAATAATETGAATEATSPDLLKVPITIETSGSRLAQMYFLRDIQEVGPRAALVTSTSLTADGADLVADPIQTTLTTQFSVFAHALTERDSELLAGVVDSTSDSD